MALFREDTVWEAVKQTAKGRSVLPVTDFLAFPEIPEVNFEIDEIDILLN